MVFLLVGYSLRGRGRIVNPLLRLRRRDSYTNHQGDVLGTDGTPNPVLLSSILRLPALDSWYLSWYNYCYMAVKVLSNKKKGEIVRSLLTQTTYQAGLQFGIDKMYADSIGVKNAVYRYYQAALVDPSKFGISEEEMDRIKTAVAARLPEATRGTLSLREKLDAEANKDIKELVMEGRKKAYLLLMRKLDRIGRSSKALDDVQLSSLVTSFGVLFDKAQIVQGQATENVAVLAKIKTDMKPEEALAAVLGMRQANIEEKEAKK